MSYDSRTISIYNAYCERLASSYTDSSYIASIDVFVRDIAQLSLSALSADDEFPDISSDDFSYIAQQCSTPA